MSITIKADKDVIKALLDTDDMISDMGFSPENIKTTGAGSEIISISKPEFQIFIGMSGPENLGSSLVSGIVYSVTVTGNRKQSNRVDEVTEQVIALLNNKDIGRGHILELLDPPLELASNPNIYIVETTFLCQSTNLNVVKKP